MKFNLSCVCDIYSRDGGIVAMQIVELCMSSCLPWTIGNNSARQSVYYYRIVHGRQGDLHSCVAVRTGVNAGGLDSA